MLFTPAGRRTLFGKCPHKHIQQMRERTRLKRTERCSTVALAAHMNELRGMELTPCTYAQQVLPYKFSTVLSSELHEPQELSISVKSVWCWGRLLISMLRWSEVWATTIFFSSESLVSSCCFSPTHYLDVSKEVWSKFSFNGSSLSAHHISPLRKNQPKCRRNVSTHIKVSKVPIISIYVSIWSCGVQTE